MDDLISRKAAIETIEDTVTSVSVYAESAEARYATRAKERFAGKISELPSVPAVPLDKLCEWLGKFANPCKIGIRCYYPDDNNEDCMPTVECWRYVLTKWMEEQDE